MRNPIRPGFLMFCEKSWGNCETEVEMRTEMKWKEKCRNGIIATVPLVVAVLLSYFIYLALFCPNDTYNYVANANTQNYDSIILATGAFVGVILLLRYRNFLENVSERTIKVLSVINWVIIVALQLLYIYNFRIISNADTGCIEDIAIDSIGKGILIDNDGYLAMCPHNSPLAIFFTWLFTIGKFFGFTEYGILEAGANMIAIDLCILFGYLICKKQYGLRAGLFMITICAINPIIYMYVPRVYNNSMSLFFYPLLLYIYQYFLDTDRKRYLVLLGLFSILGFYFRATVAIMIIAIVIHMIFLSKKKKLCRNIGIICLGIIIGMMFYKFQESKWVIFDYSDTQLPITHFMMMGSEGSGEFSAEDVRFTNSFQSYDEKVDATLAVTINNIKEYGWGNFERLHEKYINLFSSGLFGVLQHSTKLEEYNVLYPYVLGDKSILINTYIQILYIAMLVLSLMQAIKGIKNKGQSYDWIYLLYIGGTFLFYTMWEGSTRYGLMLLPALFFLATEGSVNTNSLSDKPDENRGRIPKEIKERILVYGKMLFLGLLVLVLYVQYHDFTQNTNLFYNYSVLQAKSNNVIMVRSNDIVQECFETDKSFNYIKVDVDELESDASGELIVTLKDKTHNQDILNKTVEADKACTEDILLEFPEVQCDELTCFELTIDTTELRGNLAIKVYYDLFWDVIPENVDKDKIEMEYTVALKKEETYLSSLQWIIYCVCIFGVTVVALFGLKLGRTTMK